MLTEGTRSIFKSAIGSNKKHMLTHASLWIKTPLLDGLLVTWKHTESTERTANRLAGILLAHLN